MAREIKFKAKSIIDGTWVTGSYMHYNDSKNNPMSSINKEFHQILAYFPGDWNMGGWEHVDVEPETVCQFSGLNDKNNREIFEGDIIKLYKIKRHYYEESGYEDSIKEITATVVFNGGCFCLETDDDYDGSPVEYYTSDFQVIMDDMFKYVWNLDDYPGIKPEDIDICEIIGNKFDNPELINY